MADEEVLAVGEVVTEAVAVVSREVVAEVSFIFFASSKCSLNGTFEVANLPQCACAKFLEQM